jgi:cytochrome P450
MPEILRPSVMPSAVQAPALAQTASRQTRTGSASEDHSAANAEMTEYFLALIDQRRSRPGKDLVSTLLSAEIDSQRLTVPELLGFCALLLVAGNETTTNLIGNAVLCLAESPGTTDRLLGESALLPQTGEEVLRFRSPVQSMYRVTVRETTLGDERIPAGAPIVVWIGSANRDERQFQRPAAFDVDRGQNRHLAFGHGIHFCLGAPLAQGTHLERLESTIIYGLKTLPVSWQPA